MKIMTLLKKKKKKEKKRKKSCAKPSKKGVLFDQAQKSQK